MIVIKAMAKGRQLYRALSQKLRHIVFGRAIERCIDIDSNDGRTADKEVRRFGITVDQDTLVDTVGEARQLHFQVPKGSRGHRFLAGQRPDMLAQAVQF